MEPGRAANLIESATRQVFATMLDTELGTEPFFEDPNPLFEAEVVGFIGFAGAIRGYVSLQCTLAQASAFTARLLGMEPEEIESFDDLSDAVGELVNMIIGTVKTALGSDDPIEIALPTVVMTPKSDIRVKASLGVVVPFTDPAGSFHVEFVLEEMS